MFKIASITLPCIACAAEYFIPFYGVWLVVFAILLLVYALHMQGAWNGQDNLTANDVEWFLAPAVFLLFPAALIICGIEKYNRWDGEFVSLKSWLKGDGGIVVFIFSFLLFVIFIVAVVQRLISNAATDFRDWWKKG
jgi:hypothetical protein